MPTARFFFIARLFAVAFILFGALDARAQITTATVRGKVVGDDGGAIAEAALTLINTATGASKGSISNADGEFAFNNLDVGGPYKVTCEVSGFQNVEIKDIYLSAGRTRDVVMTMKLQE